jgi:hypothetical protein
MGSPRTQAPKPTAAALDATVAPVTGAWARDERIAPNESDRGEHPYSWEPVRTTRPTRQLGVERNSEATEGCAEGNSDHPEHDPQDP